MSSGTGSYRLAQTKARQPASWHDRPAETLFPNGRSPCHARRRVEPATGARLTSRVGRRRPTAPKVRCQAVPQYKLGGRVLVDDLARFEQDNGITLPEAYREFITTVGNGGAGPYYGMYRHDGTDWNNPNYPLEERQPGFLATPFPHSERFQPYRPGYSDQDQEHFDTSWLSGSLVLAEFGCGAYFRLVVTGKARGQVWFEDFASDGGLTPGPDFHDWYQAWLDDLQPKARWLQPSRSKHNPRPAVSQIGGTMWSLGAWQDSDIFWR